MEFFFLGLLVLSFPIIAIVALVKTININETAKVAVVMRGNFMTHF